MTQPRSGEGGMIVDTHVHYREPPSADHPYRQDGVQMQEMSAEALLEAAGRAGVDAIVQVTPSILGYDNAYSFREAARRPERIVGVIARFDPMAPGMEERLAALQAEPEFLGVRFTLFNDWNETWLQEGRLNPFLEVAQRRDVAVQIFAPYRSAEMAATARRFPGVRFLFDHMGLRHFPGVPIAETYRQWDELLALSGVPNVWIKVSHFPESVATEERSPFPSAQLRLRQLYERAGATRLVWGSNFPPVQRACTYRQAVDLIRTDCSFLTMADREAILGGNFLASFAPGKQSVSRSGGAVLPTDTESEGRSP